MTWDMGGVFIAMGSSILTFIITLSLTNYLNRPFLKIKEISSPIPISYEDQDQFFYRANAYRINIKNDKKFLFGAQAKECKCEIKLGGIETPLLHWIYYKEKADINSGTSCEIDFCARCSQEGRHFKNGEIILPINGDYNKAQKIGDGKSSISGKLIISSENRGYLEKQFIIKPIDNNLLKINFQ
jgi:hypothetical protein